MSQVKYINETGPEKAELTVDFQVCRLEMQIKNQCGKQVCSFFATSKLLKKYPPGGNLISEVKIV